MFIDASNIFIIYYPCTSTKKIISYRMFALKEQQILKCTELLLILLSSVRVHKFTMNLFLTCILMPTVVSQILATHSARKCSQLNHTEHWVNYGDHTYYEYSCDNITLTKETSIDKYMDEDVINNHEVRQISVKNVATKIIPVGTFRSFADLKILHLNGSHLEQLEMGAFNGLLRLTHLYLNDNQLPNIKRGMLNSLIHLEYLNLSQNDLTEIEENSLTGLLDLKELIICHNHLLAISNQTFLSLKQLKRLDLSYNFLIEIQADCFLELRQLETLKLHHNKLVTLEDFPKMHENAFSGLFKLKRLYLQHNYLNLMPIGVFHDLNSLEIMDLSHNNITDLRYGTFSGLVQLEFLNISHNQLKSLRDYYFNLLSNLKYLDISYNSIGALNAFEFLLDLPELNKISLIGNSFSNCKNLLNAIRIFKEHKVAIMGGTDVKQVHNLHGIQCRPNFDNDRNFENVSLHDFFEIAAGNEKRLENLTRFFEAFMKEQVPRQEIKKINNALNFIICFMIVIFLIMFVKFLVAVFPRLKSKFRKKLQINHFYHNSSAEGEIQLM